MNIFKKIIGDKDVEIIVGQMLRWGVTVASIIAGIGGIVYLTRHGSQPVPDYGHFAGESRDFTTIRGILEGMKRGSGRGIIQLGVLVLLATPILRIAFSLLAFAVEKDRLYVVITFIVLSTILFSMFSGLKV